MCLSRGARTPPPVCGPAGAPSPTTAPVRAALSTDLARLSRSTALVLVPRRGSPLYDGRRPARLQMAKMGAIDDGILVAVTDAGAPLIAWWGTRSRTKAGWPVANRAVLYRGHRIPQRPRGGSGARVCRWNLDARAPPRDPRP